ncbi:TPA: hypothetical protein HA251_06985 [Candidatus Woesearchaeota archaeon]|nr:hypothetical protein [Candidatus Woesearchaeota archaeon]
MERNAQNLTATIAGLFFTLGGIIGFLVQGLVSVPSTSTMLNTFRLIIGAIAIVIGVWGTHRAARVHNRVLGMALIFVAFLSMIAGDFWGMGIADNIAHILAGGVCMTIAHTRR